MCIFNFLEPICLLASRKFALELQLPRQFTTISISSIKKVIVPEQVTFGSTLILTAQSLTLRCKNPSKNDGFTGLSSS